MADSWPVLIYLDIDGVLNAHEFDRDAASNRIDRDKVERLNRILLETDARIILSSAWRYMVHGHAMTLGWFAYMMRTHGMVASVNGSDRIFLDVTCRDEDIPDRAGQVRASMACRPGVERYVVVDDLDLGFTEAGLTFVQTDGTVGLTDSDADLIIELLNTIETEEES